MNETNDWCWMNEWTWADAAGERRRTGTRRHARNAAAGSGHQLPEHSRRSGLPASRSQTGTGHVGPGSRQTRHHVTSMPFRLTNRLDPIQVWLPGWFYWASCSTMATRCTRSNECANHRSGSSTPWKSSHRWISTEESTTNPLTVNFKFTSLWI